MFAFFKVSFPIRLAVFLARSGAPTRDKAQDATALHNPLTFPSSNHIVCKDSCSRKRRHERSYSSPNDSMSLWIANMVPGNRENG